MVNLNDTIPFAVLNVHEMLFFSQITKIWSALILFVLFAVSL